MLISKALNAAYCMLTPEITLHIFCLAEWLEQQGCDESLWTDRVVRSFLPLKVNDIMGTAQT